jgi:RNA polymerase sigma-70 factor (ECF subfamily)
VSLDQTNKSQDSVDIGSLINLLEGNDGDPLEHVAQLERGQWVQQAVSELSTQMRGVIDLVYYQGMKYREAADILGVPVGTVKSRLHAAVVKLNEVWARTMNEQ